MAHSEIKQITSRNVSYQIELMEWSKKMDLIAISTKGDIIIHRFKWQKVWSFPAPAENLKARKISWRNDEKLIAVGYNTGLVVLLDIENKEEVHSFNLNCDISSMMWTNCSRPILNLEDTMNQNFFDHTKFLPPLPSLNSMSSNTKKTDYNTLRFYSKDSLNILITGLIDASLNLSIFGMITCATVDLKPLFPNEEHIEVKDVVMSDDLKQLYVVVKANDSTQVLIYENDLLPKYSISLLKITTQHGLIKNSLSYIRDTIQSITESWETVLLEMDNKLIKFADTQPQGSLSADFLELLMFGYPSTTALYQFLTKELTEKGLKKLANSIELSYSTIQKLVVKPLTTAGVNILYHLNTLKGMSKNKYFYGDLLNDSVDEAVSSAGSLLVKSNELQQTIETSMRDYKIFFRWLYAVIVRLMDETVPDDIAAVRQQEINYLADFLKNLDDINEKIETDGVAKRKFNLERVGQYLEDKNLIFPPKDDCPNSWKSLLDSNECLKKCPNIFPHDRHLSLIQQFNKLSSKIDETFNYPQVAISKGFELRRTAINPLLSPQVVNDVHSTSIYIQEERVGLFIVLDNKKELTFFETNDKHQVKTVKLRLFTAIKGTSDICFQHIQFYNENTLSVLLNSQSSLKNSTHFMQFPVAKLREISHPFSNGDQMRVIDMFEIVDESIIKPIEGIDGLRLAVSGPRKVSSILSHSKKSIKIYEMEIDEDDEELLETSSQNASGEC